MRIWLRIQLGLLLILPAFAIGGVHPQTQMAAAGCACIFVLFSVLYRMARSQPTKRWHFGGWSWLFLAAVGMTMLQLLPLPPWLIALLSPDAHETYSKLLTPLGLYQAGDWQPLSLSPADTSVKWLRDIGGLALFLGVAHWTRSREHVRLLIRITVVGAIALILLTLFQTILGVTGPLMGLYRPGLGVSGMLKGSPFVNSNHLGGYLMFHGILCMFMVQDAEQGKERWIWGAALGILSLGVVASLSRGAILAYGLASIGFFYFLGKKVFDQKRADQADEHDKEVGDSYYALGSEQKREGKRSSRDPKPLWSGWYTLWSNPLLRGFGFVFLFVGCISLYWGGTALRDTFRTTRQSLQHDKHVAIYQFSTPLIKHYPLVGVGRGAMSVAWPRYTNTKMLAKAQITATYVESQVIQPLVDWGLLFGLLFLLAGAWLLWRMYWRCDGLLELSCWLAIAALLLQNVVDFNLEFVGTAFPFLAVLAALDSLHSRQLASRKARKWPAWVSLGVGLSGLVMLAWVGPLALRHNLNRVNLRWKEVKRAPADELTTKIKELMKHHPADFTLPLHIGQHLLRQTNPPFVQVLQWLERAKHLNPTSAGLHLVYAEVYAELGLAQQAIISMEKAMQLRSSFRMRIHALAKHYQLETLLLRSTRSIYLMHTILPSWHAKYQNSEEYTEIINELRQHFPLDSVAQSSGLNHQFNLYKKASITKDPEAPAMRKALLIETSRCMKRVPLCKGRGLGLIGKLSAMEGNHEEATKYYLMATKAEPENQWPATVQLMQHLVSQKQYQRILDLLAGARKQFVHHSQQATLYAWEGLAYERLEKPEQAKEAYEEAVTHGDLDGHWLALARVCWSLNDTRRALKILRRLIKKPNNRHLKTMLKLWETKLQNKRIQPIHFSPLP